MKAIENLVNKDIVIYFSSDHHFGHLNIIQYCKRPFSSVEEMNEQMAKRWNSIVKQDDVVYYLGDFSLLLEPVEIIAPKLNGQKILIMGNHDRCHPLMSKKRVVESEPIYRKAGFQELLLETKLNIADQKVRLCHFPYASEPDFERYNGGKMEKYRPEDRGEWLLCGHIHEKWKIKNKMINVGVDVWDYLPVPITSIEKIILERN